MLKRLLSLIATNDGVSSLDELAREMGVPRLLVKQLMAEAVRAGYLRRCLAGCTPAGCAGCHVRVSCHQPAGFALWELTNKGRACSPDASALIPLDDDYGETAGDG
jgi:L-amino acid N-acyltransferase YncA